MTPTNKPQPRLEIDSDTDGITVAISGDGFHAWATLNAERAVALAKRITQEASFHRRVMKTKPKSEARKKLMLKHFELTKDFEL